MSTEKKVEDTNFAVYLKEPIRIDTKNDHTYTYVLRFKNTTIAHVQKLDGLIVFYDTYSDINDTPRRIVGAVPVSNILTIVAEENMEDQNYE